MLTIFLVILEVVSSLALVLLVLLHSGKGGGLSDLLGGTVGATASGSTVAERNLDRITVLIATIFMFSAVALSLRL